MRPPLYVAMMYMYIQCFLIASSDQQQSPQCYEGIPAPAPHEASAEVRQTSCQTGTWLTVREGGREVSGGTLSTQLH